MTFVSEISTSHLCLFYESNQTIFTVLSFLFRKDLAIIWIFWSSVFSSLFARCLGYHGSLGQQFAQLPMSTAFMLLTKTQLPERSLISWEWGKTKFRSFSKTFLLDMSKTTIWEMLMFPLCFSSRIRPVSMSTVQSQARLIYIQKVAEVFKWSTNGRASWLYVFYSYC